MTGSIARLRALAARILDLRTMERVIDPLLADLHAEYEEANWRGYVWKRRRTLPVPSSTSTDGAHRDSDAGSGDT